MTGYYVRITKDNKCSYLSRGNILCPYSEEKYIYDDMSSTIHAIYKVYVNGILTPMFDNIEITNINNTVERVISCDDLVNYRDRSIEILKNINTPYLGEIAKNIFLKFLISDDTKNPKLHIIYAETSIENIKNIIDEYTIKNGIEHICITGSKMIFISDKEIDVLSLRLVYDHILITELYNNTDDGSIQCMM